jgi:hypothetical protein
MKKKPVIALSLLALITAVLLLPRESTIKPLLINGSFEGDWHLAAVHWTPGGGPYFTQFMEITPPEGWTAWWREGFPCVGIDEWLTGRPEVRVVSMTPDAERVHSGEQATQVFTFWRCHTSGLLQQVPVKPCHYYTFSVYAHSWYSRCSLKPHQSPLDTDCKTPILWAQDWLSVGIDPAGGIDPLGPGVVWGTRKQIYGRYAGPLVVEHVQAQGETITVFMKSEASHPLKHNDFFTDSAVLLDVTHRAFLPFVARGTR